MAWIGGVAMGLGSVIGGLFSSHGQSEANRANAKMAREQMAFQEKMSNTAVWRRMQDLKNAGLNPALGMSSAAAGASSPSGAMATMGNEGEGIGQGIAGAGQAVAMGAQIKQMKANTALTAAQTLKTNAEAKLTEAQVPFSAGNAWSEFHRARDAAREIGLRVEKLLSEEPNWQAAANADKELIPIRKELEKLRLELERYNVPEAKANAMFWQSMPDAKTAEFVKSVILGAKQLFGR